MLDLPLADAYPPAGRRAAGRTGDPRLPNELKTAAASANKKPIGIEKLIEWAFGTEKAQLERGQSGQGRFVLPSHLGYRSMESAMIELARLGVRVDTSPAGAKFLVSDAVHIDAEMVAEVVATRDRQIALLVEDCGRTGIRPSWMPGAVPKVRPAAMHGSRRGPVPATEQAGPSQWSGGVWRPWMAAARGNRKAMEPIEDRLTPWERSNDVRRYLGHVTPIVYETSPDEIHDARARYLAWWLALHETRELLIEAQVLKVHVLTREMPPATPWLAGKPGVVEIGPRPDWRKP